MKKGHAAVSEQGEIRANQSVVLWKETSRAPRASDSRSQPEEHLAQSADISYVG